jgi:hypothetical protein
MTTSSLGNCAVPMPIRGGVVGAGCAGLLAGLNLVAAFAVGLVFLGAVRAAGAFFVGFCRALPVFPTVLAFVRVAALAARGFLRFAFAVRLAFMRSSYTQSSDCNEDSIARGFHHARTPF